MLRIRVAALAGVVLTAAACASSSRSTLAPQTLAAADPASPESPYSPPESTLRGNAPRTLGIDIPDPARMRQPETPPKMGAHGGHAHPEETPPATATPAATATPRPSATKKTSTPTPTPAPTANATVYVCPMHPEVRDTKPGTCPKCGMHLEPEPKPSRTPAPAPTPPATPSPTGHEHHHGGAS